MLGEPDLIGAPGLDASDNDSEGGSEEAKGANKTPADIEFDWGQEMDPLALSEVRKTAKYITRYFKF